MIRAVRRATLLFAVLALSGLFLRNLGGDALDMAARALHNRDPDLALRFTTRQLAFARLTGLSPEERARAHTIRAQAARERGRTDFALKDMSEAIRISPESSPLRILRGVWLLDTGDCAGARMDFDHALSADSTGMKAADFAEAARAHLCTGDRDGASSLLDQAFALKKDSAEAFFTRSLLLEKIGDKRAALLAMERAWNLRNSSQGLSYFFLTPQGDVWLQRLVQLRMENGLDPLKNFEGKEE